MAVRIEFTKAAIKYVSDEAACSFEAAENILHIATSLCVVTSSAEAAEERAAQFEHERDTLRVQLDFEMAHSQRMMEERDRANAGFAALSKEYDKAMTRLAKLGEKVTA